MKNSIVSVTIKAGLGLCLLLLAGCASSPPSHYYVLNALSGDGKAQSADSCASIGIGPVDLPEYVNRLQIVARSAQDEVLLGNFDLWAEPLSESVPRVLAENLSRLLCTKEIVLFPWKPSKAPEYRVEVGVVQMDGTLGGAVSLEAWWSVSSGGENKTRAVRKTRYSEPVGGRDYTALVQAHSRALAALSRDIAAALKELGAP
jgi:uncharacterized protein